MWDFRRLKSMRNCQPSGIRLKTTERSYQLDQSKKVSSVVTGAKLGYSFSFVLCTSSTFFHEMTRLLYPPEPLYLPPKFEVKIIVIGSLLFSSGLSVRCRCAELKYDIAVGVRGLRVDGQKNRISDIFGLTILSPLSFIGKLELSYRFQTS